jgi:hypothetical protein
MARKVLVVFALVVALACSGCRQQPPAQLTAAERAAIRDEVMATVKAVFAAAESLDMEAGERMALDGPEFFYLMPDGKVLSLAELLEIGKEMIASLSGQKLITQQDHLIVLGRDAALYVWQGRNDLVQKDGTVLRADPYAATYLFRRVDGVWKFAYAHESGLPYQPVQPDAAAPAK